MRCFERWRESYPEGGQAELQYSAGQFKVHLQLFGGLHHHTQCGLCLIFWQLSERFCFFLFDSSFAFFF